MLKISLLCERSILLITWGIKTCILTVTFKTKIRAEKNPIGL